ncbi:MAG: type III pantothenate kinase [Cyanobacteriota bacterium]
MSEAPSPRWLLIGNSRWHWAERSTDGQLRGWDAQRPGSSAEADPPPWAWAAVGPLPDPTWAPAERQVSLRDVPLAGCPPWLGVDRALAGWGAWREGREAVLVVDAGTVLSLTRVDAEGRFRGGRLLAGLGLQLEAMAQGTARLPRLRTPVGSLPETWQGGGEGWEEDPEWPLATAAAMGVGVETALAAAVVEAAQASGSRRLVLTGGDGPMLWRRLRAMPWRGAIAVNHRPLLCLESLARLRPVG